MGLLRRLLMNLRTFFGAILMACGILLTFRILAGISREVGFSSKKSRELRKLTFEDWERLKPAQDNYDFVYFVGSKFIEHPRYDRPYRLSPDEVISVDYPSEHRQVEVLMPFFEQMTNGFFLEAGAHDGEHLSNTLWLEVEKQWSGLLVEGDPVSYSKLRNKQRRAWISPACLSPAPFPMKLRWYRNSHHTGINGLTYRSYHPLTEVSSVKCIPLYSLLLALGRTRIDYFSLDIEGSELDVLKTIPFDKITFKLISIEYVHIQSPDGSGKRALKEFMKSKGYILYGSVYEDLIFIHPSMEKYIPSRQRESL